MAKSKSLVVISDIHCGSKYAVCSEHPERNNDSDYKPNPNQKKLLGAWDYCIDQISQKPNALIINGEPIEGDHKHSAGGSTWSSNLNDQMNDFVELLDRMKYEELIFVKGTPWHSDKENTNFEETIADKLNVRKYESVMGNKTFADFECNIEIFGKHINFTHHLGWSSWWMYRTTPIAKELIKMHFAHKESGFHTDVLVRSHVHYYVEVRFPNTKGLSTPAWKFPDGFMYKKGEPELPTIGMVEIIVEPNGKIEIEPHLVQTDFKKPVIHL